MDNEYQGFFDDSIIENETDSLFDGQDESFEVFGENDLFESFLEDLTISIDENLENEDINSLDRYTQQNVDGNIDTFVFNEVSDDGIVFESDGILDELISQSMFQIDDDI